ncbi:MAG: ATP-dependent helicase, partial [Halioglobus sp.]|nr:ATP-dependent helicase [Halioglobus sp.]
GRAGAPGIALSFVTAPEWNLMIAIQRYLKLSFERRTLAGLKARFNGPKKQKSSGKAVGSKKKSRPSTDEKARSRQRNKKQVGKRRRPATPPTGGNDGFAPLKKRDPGR